MHSGGAQHNALTTRMSLDILQAKPVTKACKRPRTTRAQRPLHAHVRALQRRLSCVALRSWLVKPRPYATSTCSRGPQRHILALCTPPSSPPPTTRTLLPPGAGLVVLLPTLRLQLAASAPGGRHARRASATPLTRAEHARGGCLLLVLRTACASQLRKCAAALAQGVRCAHASFAAATRNRVGTCTCLRD